MTSEELQQTQDTLQELIILEINQPMKNYTKINRLIKTLKDVDTTRRDVWNKEKFGVYEEIVDNVYSGNFNSDDIPF